MCKFGNRQINNCNFTWSNNVLIFKTHITSKSQNNNKMWFLIHGHEEACS